MEGLSGANIQRKEAVQEGKHEQKQLVLEKASNAEPRPALCLAIRAGDGRDLAWAGQVCLERKLGLVSIFEKLCGSGARFGPRRLLLS